VKNQSIPLIIFGHVDPMMQDIGRDLANKTRRVLADAVVTCNDAGLDREELIKTVMGVYMSELLRASYVVLDSEEEFVGMCRTSYQRWKEHEGE